jgi:hypothetical protein
MVVFFCIFEGEEKYIQIEKDKHGGVICTVECEWIYIHKFGGEV